MKVELLSFPTEKEWMEVKRRALVTIGKAPVKAPDEDWKMRILKARHSPIRFLTFSFLIECPYWVAMHITRHHAGVQPYVRSQRNDRQADYDRTKAPQDAPVTMILDVNAEALLTMANKRLCRQAALETRALVSMMCGEVQDACPEFRHELVPMCIHQGGICPEMESCGLCPSAAELMTER